MRWWRGEEEGRGVGGGESPAAELVARLVD